MQTDLQGYNNVLTYTQVIIYGKNMVQTHQVLVPCFHYVVSSCSMSQLYLPICNVGCQV